MASIPLLTLDNRSSFLELLSFQGKTVLVTGAAGQIGLMSAAAFAELGARVILSDLERMEAEIQLSAQDLSRRYGADCAAIPADVTDPASVEALMERIEETAGCLDAVHSNTGVAFREDNAAMGVETWNRTLDINVKGMLLIGRAAANMMKRHGRSGAIVNTASMSGHIINRRIHGQHGYEIAYPTSKAAVLHLTKALAAEYVHANVRFNSVSPGYVYSAAHNGSTQEKLDWDAGCIPMKRFASAQEISGAVVYLASGLASYVTGADILVDGGYTTW